MSLYTGALECAPLLCAPDIPMWLCSQERVFGADRFCH
jgi:hypothetical protein